MFSIIEALKNIFGSWDEFERTKSLMSDSDFRKTQEDMLDIDETIKQKRVVTKEYYKSKGGGKK